MQQPNLENMNPGVFLVKFLVHKGEQDSQIWMPECDSFPRFSR